jgi:hypothetical protein
MYALSKIRGSLMGIFWTVFGAIQLLPVSGSNPGLRPHLVHLNMFFFEEKPAQ